MNCRICPSNFLTKWVFRRGCGPFVSFFRNSFWRQNLLVFNENQVIESRSFLIWTNSGTLFAIFLPFYLDRTWCVTSELCLFIQGTVVVSSLQEHWKKLIRDSVTNLITLCYDFLLSFNDRRGGGRWWWRFTIDIKSFSSISDRKYDL